MQLIYWYAQQLLRHLQGHKQTITDPGQGVDEHAEQTWLDDHRADESFVVNENIRDHLQIPAMVSSQSKPKGSCGVCAISKGVKFLTSVNFTLIYLITQSRGQELIYIFNSSFHPCQRRKDVRRKDERRKETVQMDTIEKTRKLWISQKLRFKKMNAVHS